MHADQAAMRWPDLYDFWIAPVNRGPRAADWENKPHRLVYELICLVGEARANAERLATERLKFELALRQISDIKTDVDSTHPFEEALTNVRGIAALALKP